LSCLRIQARQAPPRSCATPSLRPSPRPRLPRTRITLPATATRQTAALLLTRVSSLPFHASASHPFSSSSSSLCFQLSRQYLAVIFPIAALDREHIDRLLWRHDGVCSPSSGPLSNAASLSPWHSLHLCAFPLDSRYLLRLLLVVHLDSAPTTCPTFANVALAPMRPNPSLSILRPALPLHPSPVPLNLSPLPLNRSPPPVYLSPPHLNPSPLLLHPSPLRLHPWPLPLNPSPLPSLFSATNPPGQPEPAPSHPGQ
jgi:hypothetical protein